MPCWPRPDTSCCAALEPDNPSPAQAAQIERTLHVATEIIWRLSGKQFGACPVTVRPCRQKCAATPSYGYWSGMQWMPVLDGGVWFNQNCSKCKPSGCSCGQLDEVDLPGPAIEIVRVKLDGIQLPADKYRVDNFRKLVALDPAFPWPTCQPLNLPDTEDGTFSVTYRRGQAVPIGGTWAAGLLACQLLKACNEPGECVLPSKAQRIARQGVTVELTPVLVKAGDFATNIPEVDLWLTSVNPYKSKAPSRVYSVDRPAPRTQTWPCD